MILLVSDIVFETDGIEIEYEFQQGTGYKGGGEVSGEVVVEEKLSAHEVEGEIMGGPAEEEEAGAVVEAGAGSCSSKVQYVLDGPLE